METLLSYKLTENQSITKAAAWINRYEVLDIFNHELVKNATTNYSIWTVFMLVDALTDDA